MTELVWIIIGCIGFNVISSYFFFTENLIKSNEDLDTKLNIPKKQLMYVTICILLTIGIALLLYFYYEQTSIAFVWKRLGLLSILWAVGYIDFKTYKIPNRFILLGLFYRLAILIIEAIVQHEYILNIVYAEVISVVVLVIASVLCSIFIKNSIGFGDVKLFIVMGLMLGFESVWSAVFVSLIITFVVSVVLLITKKKNRKDSIPFAPLLMAGTYISIILTGM